MRRWFFFALILAVTVVLLSQRNSPLVTAPLPVVSTSQFPVPGERAPAQDAQRVIPPRERRVASSATVQVSASQIFPSEKRPLLVQSGRQWRFMEGAVAVSDNDPRLRHVVPLSRRAGFVIVAEADVPAGVETLPLVERSDNRQLGIFTGVIKAMGKGQLSSSEQFQATCPCVVKESYPAIQSYLLKASQDNHEELQTCLAQTGLFKRLDWEILSVARVTQ